MCLLETQMPTVPAPACHPSAGSQEAQAGVLSRSGEGEHPRSQEGKGQLVGEPPHQGLGVWLPTSPPLSQEPNQDHVHSAQMLTPITGPSASIPARCRQPGYCHTISRIHSPSHHLWQARRAWCTSGACCPSSELGRRAGLVALLPPEVLARTTAAAGAVLHPNVTQKGYPFCNSSQSQELWDTEIQCATHAKAVMSSAGLRRAVASGATATCLLPQGCGHWAVHQPKAICCLCFSQYLLLCALGYSGLSFSTSQLGFNKNNASNSSPHQTFPSPAPQTASIWNTL